MWILLFAVALAHNLIPFKNQSLLLEQIIKVLYLFHMPLFTFCTGYLVRKSRRTAWGYIKKLLVPYAVFQLAYVVLGFVMLELGVIDYSADTMKLSVVEPSSPLYFLVCMIFWRLLCPIFDEMKEDRIRTTVFLMLFAILISLDSSCNTMILPCFSLLPFYFMGYSADWQELVIKIKEMKRAKCLCLLGTYIFMVLLVPYETILFRVNVSQIEGQAICVLTTKVIFYS